jgi:hypothetical protein
VASLSSATSLDSSLLVDKPANSPRTCFSAELTTERTPN